MSSRVVRDGPHRCSLSYLPKNRGEIQQCTECGAYWICRHINGIEPGWARLTWLGRKMRGLP